MGSLKAFLEHEHNLQEQAAEYVRETAPDVYRWIRVQALSGDRDSPMDIARTACENHHISGALARAALALAEKAWRERPISSAVGNIVNSLPSDYF